MSDIQTARLQQLDAAADTVAADPGLAGDLFGLVDVIEVEPALRRHLSDPSHDDGARRQLIDRLFQGKVGDASLSVLAAAGAMRWSDGLSVTSALERQAVRAIMRTADRAGRLDDVEIQLFEVLRLVRSNSELSGALANRRRSLADRTTLLGGLLQGRVLPEVQQLAQRAVAARGRTFEFTMDGYLTLAAAQRRRGIAQVRVARPLTAEQRARLLAVLTGQAGRRLTMEVTVDPAVLGGVEVRIGDEVIDGSVSRRLEAARRAFN